MASLTHSLTHSLVLAVSLALSPSLASARQEPSPLTNELVHHADSKSRGFTSTRDGTWLYSSEGGTMVFVHTRDAQGDRVGVQYLRFEPGAAQVLTDLGRIQNTERASGTALRVNDDGSRHLLVSDYGGGIRVYGE